MAELIEDHLPVVKYNGLNTDKDAEFGGTLQVHGQTGFKESYETATADDTLTILESGKTIYIGTAGVDITLPTAASSAGIWYRFIVSANFASTSATIRTSGGENTIFGSIVVNGAIVACSAEDTITFVNTAELPGDTVGLHCDGTNWYVTGDGTTAGSITCTAS